ncbi:hypothetical protein [Halomonas denitrificans]|nr:hypothetical protein [Halomonas denitrificans]
MTAASWMSLVAAFVLTLVLTPLARAYARRRGLIDQPGPRRSHVAPVARGGGVALAVGVGAAALMIPPVPGGAAFPVGLLAIVALGFADDHRPLRVAIRLPVQLAVAAALVAAVGGVPVIEFAGQSIGPWLAWTPLAVLAIVWMINLFNFMDGSDGLASGQAAFSGLVLALGFLDAGETGLGALAGALAAASLAFLFWNRPPARIFLGDSGSLTLGYVLAFLALAGTVTGSVSVWAAAIAVSPFVIDATATLLARLVSGREWYTPHRDHAYQCLIRMGWSHARVLGALVVLDLAVVLPAFVLASKVPAWDAAIAACTGVMLLAIWSAARQRAKAENRDE